MGNAKKIAARIAAEANDMQRTFDMLDNDLRLIDELGPSPAVEAAIIAAESLAGQRGEQISDDPHAAAEYLERLFETDPDAVAIAYDEASRSVLDDEGPPSIEPGTLRADEEE